MTKQYKCPECEFSGEWDELAPVDDIHQKVQPGEFMPAGDCPNCGALIGCDDEDVPNDVLDNALRIAVARGRLPADTLREE